MFSIGLENFMPFSLNLKLSANSFCLEESKICRMGKGKLFTKQQNSRLIQIQSPCRRQNKYDSKFEICFGKSRKHVGKRRKCWLPAFSPFFQNVLRSLLSQGRGCVVKCSETYHPHF